MGSSAFEVLVLPTCRAVGLSLASGVVIVNVMRRLDLLIAVLPGFLADRLDARGAGSAGAAAWCPAFRRRAEPRGHDDPEG
ncbi:hypothetical protein [Aquisphaera insulae]|uniref:hypothetical protein n=1 Tax=Aquisphaera insulae TaxID=2712864 RepID=UPI0013EBE794|nr:hypothetical protein [Aquisphaera insulae]